MTTKTDSNLQDALDWGRKWLVRFKVIEAELIFFDCLNNSGSIDVFFIFYGLLKCLDYLSLLNWIRGLTIVSIAKTASKKIRT